MLKARLYWPAIVVSSIVSFIFEAIWFSVFMKQWLAGIGRSMEWLTTSQVVTPPVQYATAVVCSLITASVLSLVTQWTGPQTAKRGVLMGATLWFGFVATSWAKEYIFEVRTLEIFAINTVYTLIDLMILGAITGGWKAKRAA